MNKLLSYYNRLKILLFDMTFYVVRRGVRAFPADHNSIQQYNFVIQHDKDKILHLFAKSKMDLTQEYLDRIRLGDGFACLFSDQDEIVTYGWTTSRPLMPVSEIGLNFRAANSLILYDFYTREPFRRQGCYTSLLMQILTACSEKDCIIYALESNVASTKAIRSVKFEIMSVIKLLVTGRFQLF